jgi:hypothetical protein
MDFVTKSIILGAALIILATLWNILFAPKKKKIPTKIFQYFMEKHGFTTNDEAQIFNGFYEGRAVQLRKEPLGALIQVANPRGVHFIISKGKDITVTDLPRVPLKGLENTSIKCNYPLLILQVIDEELINALNQEKQFSFTFQEGLHIEIPETKDSQVFEHILHLGIKLATTLERMNYLDKK